MVVIIIIKPVIKDLCKEKIVKIRVQKTVMFSLLKDYKRQLLETKFHDTTKQRPSTVNKRKNNRNRTSNWKEVISTQHIYSSKN